MQNGLPQRPTVPQAFASARRDGPLATIRFLGVLLIAIGLYVLTRQPVTETLASQPTGDPTADAARDVLTAMSAGVQQTKPSARSSPASNNQVRIPITAQEAVAASQAGSADSTSFTAPETSASSFEEEFLRQMRVRAQAAEAQLNEDISRLRRHEQIEFAFFVCLGILTVLFISSGAILILSESGRVTVALVSGVAGLFTGAATAFAKGLARYTSRRRDQMSRTRDDTERTSQAIQAVLVIRDPQKRDAEILNLASWLRDRAIRHSPSLRGPAA